MECSVEGRVGGSASPTRTGELVAIRSAARWRRTTRRAINARTAIASPPVPITSVLARPASETPPSNARMGPAQQAAHAVAPIPRTETPSLACCFISRPCAHRKGETDAGLVARAVGCWSGKLCRRMSQLVGQRRQLRYLALGLAQLRRHELMEASLHRAALLAVPDADEISDLLQRAPELLGASDEREAGQRGVVIEPVPRRGARGGFEQSDVLVVAKGGRGEAAPSGDLADGVGAHARHRKPSSRLEGQGLMAVCGVGPGFDRAVCSSSSTSDRSSSLSSTRWRRFSGWRGCTRATASTSWLGQVTSRSATSTSRSPIRPSCRTCTSEQNIDANGLVPPYLAVQRTRHAPAASID